MSRHERTEDEKRECEAPWEDAQEPQVPQSAIEGAEQITNGKSVSLEELLADARSVDRE